MVQIRATGQDAERVVRVLELLLPLIESSPDLRAGDVTERGGGGRFIFDLAPVDDVAGGAGSSAGRTVRVEAERADRPRRPARARRDVGGGQRALPPGGFR
ncbi:hypothetical protein ACIOJE_35195 [Kitasatospora sp. NPDC087861]|uniref:hypothetical protein n=1 Tax=Kitasatospora sp. NPDC087861 TaxID=3364070 RepID=UPI0037F30C3B